MDSKQKKKSVKKISSGIYTEYSCKERGQKIFKPLPHQINLLETFVSSSERGIVLYHKLGSGKTCSSIFIADHMIQNGLVEHVYVLSPGSLRGNFISEYCLKCGVDTKSLHDDFTFITYNYNVGKNLNRVDFNNSLVIIDEVHNLIQGVVNESKNPMMIYNTITESNARVLALSGTPITTPSQFPYLLNLVKNQYIKPSSRIEDLAEYASNVISFYPGYEKGYPTVNYQPPIQVKMSQLQTEKYNSVYRYESIMRNRKPNKRLKITDPKRYELERRRYLMALLWVQSRKVSNFFYTDDIETKPDLLTSKGGWISDKTLKNGTLKYLSPKFVAVINNILDNYKGKHIIYSFFKTKSGVVLLHTLLNKCGIPSVIFSGDETTVRKNKIVRDFNKPSNNDGSKIKVLLVTEAGAEGINLMATNNMHILESSPREYKTEQAIGRIVRYKSHDSLPPNRQFVNIWRYWSKPVVVTSTSSKFTDEEMHDCRTCVLELEKYGIKIDITKKNEANAKQVRKLLLKYHPDKNKDPDSRQIFELLYNCYQLFTRGCLDDILVDTDTGIDEKLYDVGLLRKQELADILEALKKFSVTDF